MASIFSHAIAAVAIGKTFPKTVATLKLLSVGALCAMLPDADVLAFKFGIPYEHPLGHRGFTHSILFAVLFAFVVGFIVFREYKYFSTKWFMVVAFLFLSTVSHGLLDALTNGGRGVGFFIPFDNTRYFFPWRPVQVSPIGASRFFSEWGLRVIKSELLYIALPAFIWIGLMWLVKKGRS